MKVFLLKLGMSWANSNESVPNSRLRLTYNHMGRDFPQENSPCKAREETTGFLAGSTGGLVSSTFIIFKDTVDMRLEVQRGLQGKHLICPFIRNGGCKNQEQP